MRIDRRKLVRFIACAAWCGAVHVLGQSGLSTVIAQTNATDCTVKLAWDANTEPDLAGYKLYWGVLPGQYSRDKLIDKTSTETTVGVSLATWYFTVKAYNDQAVFSGYSNEVMFKCQTAGSNIRIPLKLNGITVVVVVRG